jgi:serine/threonine protein kinase
MLVQFLLYILVSSIPVHIQRREILSRLLFPITKVSKVADIASETTVNTAKKLSLPTEILMRGKMYPLATIPSVVSFKELGNVKIPIDSLGAGQHGIAFLTNTKAGLLHENVVVKIPKFIPSVEAQVMRDNNQFLIGLFSSEIEALKKMGQYIDDVVLPDGRVIIAMKLVKGSTLLSFIKDGNIKTKEEFIELMKATGKAVKKVHAQGIIHHDLHAGNVMVQRNT